VNTTCRGSSAAFRRRFGQPEIAAPDSFTLVELLVCVAIIALLASLLLAVLSRVKAKAHSAACQNNLRQLILGWTLYAGDNDDRLAGSISVGRVNQPGSWVLGNAKQDGTGTNIVLGLIFPYAPAVRAYRCPADRATVGDRGVLRTRSYTLNGWMNSSANDPAHPDTSFTTDFPSMPHTLAQILRPPASGTFVFIDEQEESIDDGLWNNDPFALAFPGEPVLARGASPLWYNLPADRHHQAANIAFADSHVETHRWSWPKRHWDPNRPERAPENRSDQQDLIYTLQLSPVAGY